MRTAAAELWGWTPYRDGQGRWHTPVAVGVDNRVIPLPLAHSTLLAAGFTRRRIQGLVRDGVLVKVRNGWYAGDRVDRRLVSAVRSGSTLTCHSALSVLGVWTVPDPRLHVRTPVGRNVLRAGADDLVEHRTHRRHQVSATATCLDGAEDALRVAAGCLDGEMLIVAADSALQRGLIAPEYLDSLTPRVNQAAAAQLSRVDGRAQSGTETRVRLFCQELGVPVVPQFEYVTRRFVDLLVGERLVIELDSEQFHSSKEDREADARRTAQLLALGYFVVRLTYRQVWTQWDVVACLLRTLVSRGEHRWRDGVPRPHRPAA